ncbi:MAG: twin-arginine translocation signal domain-containing protein [Verrucomicrobia bacterium]|nr:twin-arginine translocation signal domain-containing protein [Verrucomicrobiota bacterium]
MRSAPLTRRDLLKAGLATGAAAMLPSSLTAASSASNPIVAENRREGARDWQLTRVRVDPVPNTSGREAYRSSTIEGYCSRQSVAAGETIEFMVSTSSAARFQIEIFRNGYYGGRGARHMTTLGPFRGTKQPEPAAGDRRLVECSWASSASLKIPADWLSGVYLGRLTTLPERADQPYWQSYVVFIVRDERPADILFQCSDNTWQAYNRWPTTFSLYDDGTPSMTSTPWVDASFDRPYGKYRQIYDNPQSVGSGEWLCWEFPLAYWLEAQGYDVTYCSQADMLTPARGLKCKTFLSVGHDEYWDERSYHAVAAMRDAGVNLAFLSGNSVCWVTPFGANARGVPNRRIHREAPYGGMSTEPGFNEKKMYSKIGPDEGLLMGAVNVIPVNGGGDWIVAKPEHWLFAGTGLKKGDSIPGLVGWEYHGKPAKIPGLEVVAEGTAWKSGTQPQRWAATVYPGPKNNWVFNAATIFWSQALSSPPGHMLPWSHWNRPHGPDDRVQRIMTNFLERCGVAPAR